jgi:ABC-type transport system involved in multi-copper enzyme maturation permease subunit
MNAAAVLLRKEVRAQAVPWLAITAAILAGELPGHDVRGSGMLVYVFGALALGAASIGHEYRHGTMSQLLTLPVHRATVLAVKIGVLTALLLVVAALGYVVLVPHLRWNAADREAVVALFVLPPLYGLFVAPWLALKTRSTLAGTLFSGSLAALLVIAGDRIGAVRFASDREIDAFKMTVLWTGSSLLFVCAAVALWRSFQGLDVIEGVRADIALPAALRAARAPTPVRRNPFLLLAAKELRLQQLTFVASLLYCVLYAVLWARRASLPPFGEAIAVATTIHAIIVAALAGALSCAEERALGTLQWQLLQPMSARMQFAVKVAMTAALTFALALGLPALLSLFTGAFLHASIGPPGHAALMLLLLLSGSIYLSSVAGSALIAFFACVPAFMVVFWFMTNVVVRVAVVVFGLFHRLPRGQIAPGLHAVPGGLARLVWGVFVLLVLAFAFENHRDADRSPRRAVGQLLGLAALLVVTAAGFAAAGRFL